MARNKSNSGKSLVRKRYDAVSNSLFCKRSIIVVSEHKTLHIPIAVSTQMMMSVAALALVGWASYTSGSFMAASHVLQEKDQKLATESAENQRFVAEFGLLKRDLMTLAQDEQKGKGTDYAKMVADRYAKAETNIAGANNNAAVPTTDNKYGPVFQRIDYLEAKVKSLQTEHDQMVSEIKDTTGGKIAELERVISTAGLDKTQIVQKAELEKSQNQQRLEKYGRIEKANAAGGQGGPYEPIKSSMLKEKDPDLYFNLKRLMTLNEVVSAMPLAFPMDTDEFRVTSGFGVRVDPFRGRMARHEGVDIAGPEGSRILTPNEGKVIFVGWKTAYGNTVDIDHGHGFVTRYGHLSKALVTDGQTVHKGQVIAIQGATGRTTGSHLHYEVRYDDEPMNPGKFLKAGANVRATN